MSTATSALAVLGGERHAPEGTYRNWPPIDDIDREMVLDSLNSDWHGYAGHCQQFVKEFAAWNGNRHAIFTNSGTAAIHMGLVACGVGAGDHVLVTAYSWSSSATAIMHHNAIPVFVDIDFDTINMDPDKIEAAITPRTKAIVVVHLHGLAVDMDTVMAIARKHNLKVIEDACQAHGATFRGRKAGTFGDCAAFSFNQNKCLCAGEGGMFVTNDETMLKAAQQLWCFGETRMPSEKRDFHAYALGWMYRPSDLQAAFGRAQLTKLDRYLAIQRENAAAMTQEIRDIPALILPTVPEHHDHTFYNFTMRLDMARLGWTGDPAVMRDAIMKAIIAEGVWGVDVWQRFILPSMTVFRAKNAYGLGCPWSCPLQGEEAGAGVDYDPACFPVAQHHAETHIGMTTALRAPNGVVGAKRAGEAIRKVMESIHSVDPERILASEAR